MMADRKKLIETAPHEHGSDKTGGCLHFKPLSVYSRMVYCSVIRSCSVNRSCPNSPPWNLKVELINSRATVVGKRRFDDSCLDETYDTPPKKPLLVYRSSPDSSCALTGDSFNPYRQVKLVSKKSPSVGLEIERIEETLSCQKSLGLDWTNSSEMTAGQSSTSLTNVCSSSPVLVPNKDSADVVAFDYDIDEIMCLSPIDSGDTNADGVEDFIQSYQNSEEGQFSINRDEGYVTKSYPVAPGESTVLTESEIIKSGEKRFVKSLKITLPNLSYTSPLVSTPITSTPLEKSGELVKCLENSSDYESQPSPTINCKHVKDSSAIAFNSDALKTEAIPTVPFLNIKQEESNLVPEGTTICKSLDHKQTAIQVKENKEVLCDGQQQADTDNKLPLEVQVMSNDVLPDIQQPRTVNVQQQPGKKVSASQENALKDIPRPMVLYREEVLEKEKKLYVDSVRRHMADNKQHGVMSELLCLIKDVSNQERGGNRRGWQSPSDLTRRNYRLSNSGRLLSLDQWQNLNYRHYARFAQVPLVFKRTEML